MSDGYVPRAGTTAHKILEFLRKQGQGAQFTTQELAAKLKVKHVAAALRKAVEAEALAVEKQGNAYLYSLPAPPQPTDGKLQIGVFSDGDIVVSGGTPNEDGSVTYTREQLLQLIAFVTHPAIGTPVATELLPAARPMLTSPVGAQE